MKAVLFVLVFLACNVSASVDLTTHYKVDASDLNRGGGFIPPKKTEINRGGGFIPPKKTEINRGGGFIPPKKNEQ